MQLNDPGADWLTVWKRWQSGVLSKISRNISFFFLHDKTMTRVFVKKIYPTTDETCQRCQRGPETQIHRYIGCESVGEVWGWVRFRLHQMDSSHASLQDSDFLYLRFSRGLRDEDILWLLEVYLEYVEDNVVLRGQAASVDDFVGHVKYKWVMANYQTMPALGLIPGTNNIDLNARGGSRNMPLALGMN